jgi:hypothetical protein
MNCYAMHYEFKCDVISCYDISIFFLSCSRQCSFMTIVIYIYIYIFCKLQESLGLLAQGGAVYLAPKKCCFSLCCTKFFLTTSPI